MGKYSKRPITCFPLQLIYLIFHSRPPSGAQCLDLFSLGFALILLPQSFSVLLFQRLVSIVFFCECVGKVSHLTLGALFATRCRKRPQPFATVRGRGAMALTLGEGFGEGFGWTSDPCEIARKRADTPPTTTTTTNNIHQQQPPNPPANNIQQPTTSTTTTTTTTSTTTTTPAKNNNNNNNQPQPQPPPTTTSTNNNHQPPTTLRGVGCTQAQRLVLLRGSDVRPGAPPRKRLGVLWVTAACDLRGRRRTWRSPRGRTHGPGAPVGRVAATAPLGTAWVGRTPWRSWLAASCVAWQAQHTVLFRGSDVRPGLLGRRRCAAVICACSTWRSPRARTHALGLQLGRRRCAAVNGCKELG